jgi:hypothetical protein
MSTKRTPPLPALAGLFLILACGDPPRDPPRDQPPATSSDRPTDRPIDTGRVHATDETDAGRVRLVRERGYDLTGDGRPERLRVIAAGPRFDSLDVRLEIRSPDDRLLYLAGWSSRRYFHYDPLEGKADTTVERIVRGHIDRILGDSSFITRYAIGPGGERFAVDSEVVRYDVAEAEVKRRQGIPDTVEAPLSVVIHVADDSSGVRASTEVGARTRALVAELRGRPTFTYFAGGELTNSIAWSDREQRFVRVFSCC